MGLRSVCCVTLWLGVGLLMGAAAKADDVLAGADFFSTPAPPGGAPGPTFQSFADAPLPMDFFGPGSQPFGGTVIFGGQSLTGTNLPLGTDTIVRRLQDAQLDICPSESTVPIEIVALHLVSTAPIVVDFGPGGTSSYEVRATLSSSQPQAPGSITLRHHCEEGGFFDSTLQVIPRLTFTRVAGAAGDPMAVLDPAPAVVITSTNSCWSHTDPGFGIFAAPAGTVDHDGVGATPEVPFPASGNFFPGVCWRPCQCVPGEPPEPTKRLTAEQAMRAAHGVLPSEEPGTDRDVDGIHDLADNCVDLFNPFQEDLDGDGIGDACDPSIAAIPTLSGRSLTVLALLILIGGMLALRRRAAPVPPA